MNTPNTPGLAIIAAREYVEAIERLERSKRKLVEAQKNLEAAEAVIRGRRAHFIDTMEAAALDDGGDPPAAARALWMRYQRVESRGNRGARAAILKATGEPQ